MRKILALTAAAGIAVTSLVAIAPAASAKDGDVKMRSDCTDASDWVVKVKPKKGQLRADFWVKNTAPAGQAWTLAVTQDAKPLATSTKATQPNDDDGDDDSRHTAEVKWRTWASATGGALSFIATTPSGENCTITVP